MPTFTYTARDKNGHLTTGTVDEPDRIQATRHLEQHGLTPISIVLSDCSPQIPSVTTTGSEGMAAVAVAATQLWKATRGKRLIITAVICLIGAGIVNSVPRQAASPVSENVVDERYARNVRHYVLAVQRYREKDYDKCLRLLDQTTGSFSGSSEVKSLRNSASKLLAASQISSRPDSHANATAAQPVIATREDVIKQFGEPNGDVSGSDGKETLYYGRSGKVEIRSGQVSTITGDFAKPRPQPVTSFTYPEMSAEVNQQGHYVVTVVNKNNYNWAEVEFRINSGWFDRGYRLKVGSIPAGGSSTVTVKDFINGDGLRFDLEKMAVQTLDIHAQDPGGRFQFSSYSLK